MMHTEKIEDAALKAAQVAANESVAAHLEFVLRTPYVIRPEWLPIIRAKAEALRADVRALRAARPASLDEDHGRAAGADASTGDDEVERGRAPGKQRA